VIWGELEQGGCAREVVLWNAFPWHPYRAPAEAGEATVGPCGPSSNRKPRNTEVEEGREALAALMRCFTHELAIFAVGKVAEQALSRWPQFACAGYIRHPAQGGESLFRSQFREQVLARL
jgi:uracil-DNA glycosylase